ncbi:cell wall hydrolase [Caulobacter sp. Root1455]|uniref:cell wall hydrolase n=1 Tax=Caulobacter sp. Root1455 TaxID=1736465 RepID=UPI0006F358F0|nr:cell wall hydrolase [Caulobacter sp. Root1455]KQZ06253.1 cell wall hydrolase [Caulobacter sp. Root1455]
MPGLDRYTVIAAAQVVLASGAVVALGVFSAYGAAQAPADPGRTGALTTVVETLSDAGLAPALAKMDPAMLALARRHDPRPHKDYWGRAPGWEKLDLHLIPRLGDREPDFEEARAINGFKAASPLALEPSRPFKLTGAQSERDKALHCMTQAVYFEAGFEPLAGQQAVAQTVINRVRHPGYPKSICGVIYEGAARGTGCQFSFTCDGSLERAISPVIWANAEIVAKRALAGFVMKDVGSATHYHADYVYPYWAPTLVKLRTLGAHVFYRWTGPSGAQKAFKGRYSGDETLSADILMGADPRTLEAAPPGSMAAMAATGGILPVATGEPAKIVSPEGVVEILPPMTGDPGAAMRGGRRLPTPEEIEKINKALGALEAPVVDTTVKPVEANQPPPPPPPPQRKPKELVEPLNWGF